jgi:hypothetical protein
VPTCDHDAVTRIKQARSALYVVALANAGFIVASWPRPPKLMELGTIIVCGGSVLLAYRENPAPFHRHVSPSEAARILVGLVVVLGAMILLTTTDLL